MNAYGVQALKDMGIDPGKLGCVMLDVVAPDLSGVIPDEWCYTSQHPHVTLAYVHKDRERDAVTALRRHFRARDTYVPVDFAPIGLNYGRKR